MRIGSTGTRRSSCRRTIRASCGSAATGCSSRTTAARPGSPAQDLTKNIDRNTVALLGIPGDRVQLSKNDGVVSYSTIISISESPVLPGVVWAGTDDGNVQVTRDSGATFTEVGKAMPGLPANHQYWISRIDASHFDAATAYVAVDGHRSDDLKPYLFVTHDYGKTLDERRRATCRRLAISRSFARIQRTRICSTSARSSGCTFRSTAASSGSGS